MASWSQNAVHFEGNPSTIEAIYSSIKPGENSEGGLIYDFDVLQPVPQSIQDNNGPEDLIDWCYENRGTNGSGQMSK